MSTRGAYGFVVDSIEKITYNHFDSYPDVLGRKILNFIANTDINKMRKAASDIILVQNDIKPSNDQIEECKQFSNFNVSNGNNWYGLLYKTQGDLSVYTDKKLKYMIDSKNFLKNSLFCEYAYIINLDTSMLEFYRGFNKDFTAKGRYAHFKIENLDYCGVKLIIEFKLNEIFSDNIDNIIKLLKKEGRV